MNPRPWIRPRAVTRSAWALSIAAVAVCIGTMVPRPVTAQSPASGTPAEPRIKALIVSGGCCHDYTGESKVIIDTVRRVLPVDWTVAYQGGTLGTSKIPLYANLDWYKDFDIIVHNECFTDVDDPAYIRGITAAHKAGIPGMFFHCSLHSYRKAAVDDWRELMGGTSFTHPEEDQPVNVKMVATSDPIIAGLPTEWTTAIDELYIIEKFWPNAKALATAVSPEPPRGTHPVVWTNNYQGTRIFVTSLGHGATWNDPVFHELIGRGFQWALGRPVTPLPPPGRRGGGAR